MGKKMDHINQRLREFIEKQPLFFVGTAMREGTINVSPKGMDTFKVIDENTIVWLNLTGSGNETATHLQESNRMTIMFCAFEGKPLILRLYGTAVAHHVRDEQFDQYIDLFPTYTGSRQIIEMSVDLVQTSCGFGVPLMDFKSEREELTKWAERKGKEGIKDYWKEKNTISLDGHETNILNS
ncbi:MAG: pyridoxamine 5'-phosphate oxidase family protein [Bacteroidota bacterium]